MVASTIMLSAGFVVLGLSPLQDVATERVDLVELNHLYNEQGALVFDQVIFYTWCSETCRYNVHDYRLVKSPSQLPQRNWKLGVFETVWRDGEALRRVTASSYRETWTFKDPELVEREVLPKEKRAGLLRIVGKRR